MFLGKLIGVWLFLLFQIALLPLSCLYMFTFLVGMALFSCSRHRCGSSLTAAIVLNKRQFFHEMGVRPDPVSSALFKLHPVASPSWLSTRFLAWQRWVFDVTGTHFLLRGDPALQRFLFFDRVIGGDKFDQVERLWRDDCRVLLICCCCNSLYAYVRL